MKAKKQRKAFSYLRFSATSQGSGDSLRRQLALASDYAESHNLDLDNSVTFHDLGVSAFRGANAETGRLGHLLSAVEAGLIPPKSVVLVENLDRLSRQTARKALRIIENIVDNGVSVVTLNDGREYTASSLDKDPISLLMALLTFIRANEESATKSSRIEASWKRKRALAKDSPMTSICPYRMKLSSDRASFVLVPEKAAIVRRIFDDALSGHGSLSICKRLNAENVPRFKLGRREGSMWYPCNVAQMLTNTSVIGTLTPHRLEYVDGKKHRLALEPILDYYPPVVSLKVFKRVGELRRAADNYPTRKHLYPVRNILGNLLKCAACGGGMSRTSRSDHGEYLVCTAALMHIGCHFKSVRYLELESAVVGFFKDRLKDEDVAHIPLVRQNLIQLKAVLNAEVLDRPTTNRLLRSLLKAIEVTPSSGSISIHWHYGECTRLKNAVAVVRRLRPRVQEMRASK